MSESSVKRWADEGRIRAERTAGGHRRIALGEAVRFARAAGLSVVRPELLGVTAVQAGRARGPARREDAAGALHSALVEDRSEEATGLIVSMYVEGASPGWIFDVPVREALERVGELWRHEPEGIFLEHRATETVLAALAELRSLIPDRPGAPLALGGGYAGDVYRVPSAMAALVLAEAGYRVRDLGPDTPADAIVAAVEHYRPSLVWLSFSVSPADPAAAARGLERIAGALESGSVLVGGRGSADLPAVEDPRVLRLSTMAELAAYARGALKPRAATAG